jgi:hypothetical protein
MEGAPVSSLGGREVNAIPPGDGESKITMRKIGEWIALFSNREDLAKRDLTLEEGGVNPDTARVRALRLRCEILQALVKMFNDFATLFLKQFAEMLRNCCTGGRS